MSLNRRDYMGYFNVELMKAEITQEEAIYSYKLYTKDS
ncbi:hypothetical protein DF16_pBMB293orf00005 (plasmid) [Bacillus thuringiensis serovar kurstaki str. YBT-1520]|nr:hypothetical protein H175_285p081 [Bacillus thuringiensis serovar thuringiensis str. IS5056]AIM34529.1 hypothetical protein DF16_pBMB293orf00005 [Bacillus thuringiensis serovar kurstaki str. YBT-1520]KEH46236.1 hypothetical protein BG09_5052 [Bacillus thuringiensis serovar kurstaki str. HD-1]